MHPTALLSPDVVVDRDAKIGPFVLIGEDGTGPGVRVMNGSVIRSHSVIYRGVTLGERLHVGHGALIRERTSIGDDVSIGSFSVIEHSVEIGHSVRLHTRCFIPERSVLRAGAWLGPSVTVTNARYPNRPDTKARLEGVLVEEGAVVGAAVVLLPGITIGRGALIGAGAVVVRDVPAGATIVGNPGRIVP